DHVGAQHSAPQTPSPKQKSPVAFLTQPSPNIRSNSKNYRPDTTISKTSRTFSTSALGVNGFCKNATPLSSVPFSAITLYVYPDMYSTRTDGCRATTHFANSRPL